MICARCAREVAAGASECPNCGSDPLLAGRYRLDRALASDSIGVSYRATRVEDGLLVRARSCVCRRLEGPTERHELLTRLRELEHPALPHRLDELELGEGSLATLWLIDEHVAGHTLTDAIAANVEHRVDQARLIPILIELADLLAYLHAQPVPIVHGALSPKLILMHAHDRGASVLDLGLASAAVHAIGTRGLADTLALAAPEQLVGAPLPASDVWTLGAIAVVALTGLEPIELRDPAQRWRERVDIDEALADALERTLHLDPQARITAAELGRALSRIELPDTQRPVRHHPWTPTDLAEPAARTKRLAHPPPTDPKPRPRTVAADHRTRSAKPDAPVVRPEELSRELSQAHQVAASLREQQRSQLVLARLLVALITAAIAGLATYIAIHLL